jgi:spore germination protein YaaH
VRLAGGRRRGLRLTLRAVRRTGTLVLVLCAAAAAAALARVSDGPERRPPGPPPKVFAFVSSHGGAEVARLQQVGAKIDVIAPNWFGLDPATGALRGPGKPGPLLAAAQAHGIAVWPTVNALTGGSSAWQPARARARIADALVTAATFTGASGVTLDMEELRPEQRRAFSTLVREAATRLHAADRKLAVYVPRPGPREGASYDWKAIARHADLLLASGYNEHWARSAPGPTSTTSGFTGIVDRALDLAGTAKAVPLLGAFGYRWPASGSGELISTADARRLRRGRVARHADGAARFRAGDDTIVYETTTGLRRRAAAARAAGAHWIGLFSLGREPARFWDGLETAR